MIKYLPVAFGKRRTGQGISLAAAVCFLRLTQICVLAGRVLRRLSVKICRRTGLLSLVHKEKLNMKKLSTRALVRCAMIAAIYTAVSLMLAPLSYGAVQVRFAEALCLLAVLCPDAVIGVTLGCLLTNLLGSVPIDAVFGTLATLIAAIASYKLRNVRFKGLPLASAFCPVVANAVIIGAEITFFFMDVPATGAILAMNMLTVGLGELVSCVLLGLILVRAIEKDKTLAGFFA